MHMSLKEIHSLCQMPKSQVFLTIDLEHLLTGGASKVSVFKCL